MLPDDERHARNRDMKTWSSHQFLEEMRLIVAGGEELTAEDLRFYMDLFIEDNPGAVLQPMELATHVMEFGPEAIATYAKPLTELATAEIEACQDPKEKAVLETLFGIMQKGFDMFFESRGGVQ